MKQSFEEQARKILDNIAHDEIADWVVIGQRKEALAAITRLHEEGVARAVEVALGVADHTVGKENKNAEAIALRAQVAELQKELEERDVILNAEMADDYDDLQNRVAELTEENERLKEALAAHGEHSLACGIESGVSCTCGLHAALHPTTKEKSE